MNHKSPISKTIYINPPSRSPQNARSLMRNAGLGKLRPNLMLLGYKGDWNTCPQPELDAYFQIIQ